MLSFKIQIYQKQNISSREAKYWEYTHNVEK